MEHNKNIKAFDDISHQELEVEQRDVNHNTPLADHAGQHKPRGQNKGQAKSNGQGTKGIVLLKEIKSILGISATNVGRMVTSIENVPSKIGIPST